MNLKHDIPENEGVANGIRRARQMTGFRWTPVASLPASIAYLNMDTGERQRFPMRLNAFFPQTGMIYSSVTKYQKHIGFNVSFETFVTALSDPMSVIYKFNVAGKGRGNANCWYGTVCSCFASYVMNLNERWICRNWSEVEGVSYLGKPEADELRLLDIVLNTKCHIAIVTDILRDDSGKVHLIEVSETTIPLTRATYFTPEEFKGYWYGKEFEIYRKSGLESIPYTPSPFVHVEFAPDRGIASDPYLPAYVCNGEILPDQGNKSNYLEKQEIVLDILSPGFDCVEVENENAETVRFEINGNTAVIPADSPFHKPGFYKAAALCRESGKISEACEYAVTGLSLRACDGIETSQDADNPSVIAAGSQVRISFSGSEKDKPYLIFIYRLKDGGETARFRVCEEDRCAGFCRIEFPENEEETYYVLMTARNAYGEYTSEYLYFRTVK